MTLTGFENVSGSYQNDTLTGDGVDNVLAGDVGNDILNGGDGADTLYGDGRIIVDTHGVGTSGPITTYGDVVSAFPGDPEIVSGNDTLNGGKGNDTLVGGGGDDLLTGGQGKDTYVFGPASGDDHVTDFAKQDVIALNGIAGVDDFSDLTIVNVGGSAVISWGTSDSITLDGYKASKLSAADFSFGTTAPFAAFAAADFGGHGHHGFEAPPPDAWMP
jgi:Ca2+-binding RTX toxin-like protein